MKRVTALALLFALALLPALASAYWDARTKQHLDDGQLPVIYATLNRAMSTRTGPSTSYTEPGTFFGAGDVVRIVSIVYDENQLPWVQVDIDYGRKQLRAYTGLKRFDGVKPGDIPREDNLLLDCTVLETLTPQCGPGVDYAPCAFEVKEGMVVSVVDYENGYDMCEADFGGKRNWRRFWIETDLLEAL